MSYIVVCPLVAVAQCVAEHKPAAAITLLDANQPTPRLSVDKHLRLNTPDDAAAGDEALVKTLLRFVAGYAWRSPLLIHCLAGISRSPAAALAVLGMLYPNHSPWCVNALQNASVAAHPNEALLATADKLLATNLLPAWQAVTKNQLYGDGVPFVLRY